MNKHFDPQIEFTRVYLNGDGVGVFPSVYELAQKVYRLAIQPFQKVPERRMAVRAASVSKQARGGTF